MSKKTCKIIIIMMVLLSIIIGIMYLIDLDKMKKGEEVVFSTWGAKYAPVLKETENNDLDNVIKSDDKNYKKYSKIVDNVYLELDVPAEWNYEEISRNEENDFYKFALKLYKNSEERYAVIYFYMNSFGVCGTGRTSENITLNNGEEAIIGYYDRDPNWSDISFYNMSKYIAVMNYGLINEEAKEVIEFIKTINIIENYNEIEVIEDIPKDEEQYEFIGTIIEATDNSIVVEPDAGTNERKSSDKISMKITRPTSGVNDFYVKGNKVKITYNGVIMESYPAQIVATKIELAS